MEQGPGDAQHCMEPNEIRKSGLSLAVKGTRSSFCSLSTQFLDELGSYILQPVLGLGEFQGELPINQIFN